MARDGKSADSDGVNHCDKKDSIPEPGKERPGLHCIRGPDHIEMNQSKQGKDRPLLALDS
jgi:hypothetical protein